MKGRVRQRPSPAYAPVAGQPHVASSTEQRGRANGAAFFGHKASVAWARPKHLARRAFFRTPARSGPVGSGRRRPAPPTRSGAEIGDAARKAGRNAAARSSASVPARWPLRAGCTRKKRPRVEGIRGEGSTVQIARRSAHRVRSC